jgi:multisubunit Na+/H+ antiporter MnhE subunit
VLRDITVGTWQVALVVLGLRPLRCPGIVAVPLGDRTDLGAVVSSLVSTLSPGELVVDIDHDRGAILVHVLDASDRDAVRARFEDFYRRHQRDVLA